MPLVLFYSLIGVLHLKCYTMQNLDRSIAASLHIGDHMPKVDSVGWRALLVALRRSCSQISSFIYCS